MKSCSFEDLEMALFVWFRQASEKGIPVSGPTLQEIARQFHRKIKYSLGEEDNGNFVASTGWLWRFCNTMVSES